MSEVTFRSDVTVELVDSMGDEQSIVRAARVSTLGKKAAKKEAEGLIRWLIKRGHGTPIEAPELAFRFEVPIFVSRQIVKHRISTINEESGRYRELEPVFYVPGSDRPVEQIGKTGDYVFVDSAPKNRHARRIIKYVSRICWWGYDTMLKFRISKEVARMILPVNTYSTLYVKMNLRSWLNFIYLRTQRYGSHAQEEIAYVAEQVRDVIAEKFPTVLDQFEKKQRIV